MSAHPPKRPPVRYLPSLASIKSEFEKFCELHGPPILYDERLAEVDLDRYCEEFPYESFEEIIQRWQKDSKEGPRHWPVMAFAAGQYQFNRREKTGYETELEPKAVLTLLTSIADHAHGLVQGMAEIQELSCRLHDESAPVRRGHIAWIDAFLSQAAAGKVASDLDESDEALVLNDLASKHFQRLLVGVEVTAKHLQSRVDLTALTRPRGKATDPSLRFLVSLAKPIWRSLSGLTASTSARNIRSGDDDPPFVLFIQTLVATAGGIRPTRKQVEAAGSRPASPTTDENFS